MKKSAKQLFKDIDFELINENPVTYINDDGGYITKYIFPTTIKCVQIEEYEEYNDNKPQGGTMLYIERLDAIQQQLKETWDNK